MAVLLATFVDTELIRHTRLNPAEVLIAFETHAWAAGVLAAIVAAILARRFFTMEVGTRT